MKLHYIVIPLFVLGLVLTACGGASTASSDSSSPAESSGIASAAAFPRTFAIASPTEVSGDLVTSGLRVLQAQPEPDESEPLTYDEMVNTIDSILDVNSNVDPGSTFNPSDILASSSDADCYGPVLAFANHPDGDTDRPELPVGDVGLWTETEGSTDEACAAAQLNARVAGVQKRIFSAMAFTGVLLRAADQNGIAEPDVGASIDVADELQALAASPNEPDKSPNITEASYERLSATEAKYTLVYRDGSASASDPANVIELTHRETDEDTFDGFLYFRSTQEDDRQQNCVKDTGDNPNSPEDDTPETFVTYNGTLLFNVDGDNVTFEFRYGGYCGSDVDARANSSTPALLNPANAIDPTDLAATINGWGNNFEVFGAEFNKSTMVGDYVYAWQAGYQDAAGRSLQVTIGESGLGGQAYFGYTADMVAATQLTDLALVGTYCNWAGPNGAAFDQQNRADKLRTGVQRQNLNRTTENDVFGATASNITYAPVNPTNDACSVVAADGLDLSDALSDPPPQNPTLRQDVELTDNLVALADYSGTFQFPTPANNPF